MDVRVLLKQARKARAEHSVKCSLTLVKKMIEKKAFDTSARGRQFHGGHRRSGARATERHCKRVHVDPKVTIDERKKRITKCKEDADRSFQNKEELRNLPLIWYYKQGPRCQKTRSTASRLDSKRDDQTSAARNILGLWCTKMHRTHQRKGEEVTGLLR